MRLRRIVVLVLVAAGNASLFLGLGLGPVTLITTHTAAQFERCAEALGAAGA